MLTSYWGLGGSFLTNIFDKFHKLGPENRPRPACWCWRSRAAAVRPGLQRAGRLRQRAVLRRGLQRSDSLDHANPDAALGAQERRLRAGLEMRLDRPSGDPGGDRDDLPGQRRLRHLQRHEPAAGRLVVIAAGRGRHRAAFSWDLFYPDNIVALFISGYYSGVPSMGACHGHDPYIQSFTCFDGTRRLLTAALPEVALASKRSPAVLPGRCWCSTMPLGAPSISISAVPARTCWRAWSAQASGNRRGRAARGRAAEAGRGGARGDLVAAPLGMARRAARGASVALRKLVEEARRSQSGRARRGARLPFHECDGRRPAGLRGGDAGAVRRGSRGLRRADRRLADRCARARRLAGKRRRILRGGGG